MTLFAWRRHIVTIASLAALLVVVLVAIFAPYRVNVGRVQGIVFVSMPYVVALGGAMMLPLLGLLQYRMAGRLSAEVRAAVLVAVVGVGALLSVLLTSRSLDETHFEDIVRATYDDYADGFAASRWLSVYLLGAGAVEIIRGWIKARSQPGRDPAMPILYALVGYYVGTLVIQLVASEHNDFSYKSLYVPVLFAAAFYLPLMRFSGVAGVAKWVVLVLNVGSLVAAVIAPNFVLHRPDPGYLPGINWRLFGLTPHANTLGPIALLAILLELKWPSRLRLARYLHLISAASVLLLAQSKTAWGAAFVILAFVVVPNALRQGTGNTATTRDFTRAVWTLLALIVVAIASAALMTVFNGADYLQNKSDLTSLTGRTDIWDITLSAWRDNIFFGYGSEIWGAKRRSEFGLYHVGQAHNQVVQTLGEAGLFGLLLLIVYLGTLLRAALAHFTASRGVVLSLLLLLLVRCVTEAPMRAEGLLSWPTFLHLLLLLSACHAMRSGRRGV